MHKPALKKRHIFLFLVIIGTIIAYLSPLRDTLTDWHKIGSELSNLGMLGYVVFIIGGAILCAIGMPRLLLYAIGGLAFGVTIGVCLSQAAALLGAYATFLFARWSGADFILRKWPSLEKLIAPIEKHSILSILIIRQIPINSFFTNIILGLSNIRQRDFLIGSFIGFLPEGIPAALLGAGLPSGDLAHIIQVSLLAALLLFFLSWLKKYFLNKKNNNKDASAISITTLLGLALTITLSVLYFVDGIPVINRWEPGFRLDVSGLEFIEGSHILLATNDHGYLAGMRSVFAPAVMIVNVNHYPPITPISIDNPQHLEITKEKWDGESIKCQTNSKDEINCFLVSGRRRELLWISASSTHNALAGHFTLHELTSIPVLNDDKNPTDFEAIAFLNKPNEPMQLLLIYRNPTYVKEDHSFYGMYKMTPHSETSSTFEFLGLLPKTICDIDDKNATPAPRISDITQLPNSNKGILICTMESGDASYLHPITFSPDGIQINEAVSAIRVTAANFDHNAPANVKVEGVSCFDNRLYIAIDTDSYSGGVYQMSEKFNTLCHQP